MEKQDDTSQVVNNGDKVDNKEVIDNYPHDGARDEEVGVVHRADPLKKHLRNRHMQMIAIGKLGSFAIL